MINWRHLFIDGEFARREQILAGLTLEQVRHKPSELSHSIYDELWHATTWQHIVVMRDDEVYAEWEKGHCYPPEQPATFEDWSKLVQRFLDGLEKALDWTSAPEKLQMEVDPGVTMADVLPSLAMHTTYHLGKIVALRQVIGAWPPTDTHAGESSEM